jgi:hypothetical protein
MSWAPDGKRRHRIGRPAHACLPGGRPPVPPDVRLRRTRAAGRCSPLGLASSAPAPAGRRCRPSAGWLRLLSRCRIPGSLVTQDIPRNGVVRRLMPRPATGRGLFRMAAKCLFALRRLGELLRPGPGHVPCAHRRRQRDLRDRHGHIVVVRGRPPASTQKTRGHHGAGSQVNAADSAPSVPGCSSVTRPAAASVPSLVPPR